MGDVRNRGTDAKPQWYCRYVDIDGKRKQRATKQLTESDALRYLAEIEAKVARQKNGVSDYGFEDSEVSCGFWFGNSGRGYDLEVVYSEPGKHAGAIAGYGVVRANGARSFEAWIDWAPEMRFSSEDELDTRIWLLQRLEELAPC